MSALQASRIYKVPSRTLYDKVKKLGIAQTRPMNRALKQRSPNNNGSSPASFPYGISGISGTRSPLSHHFEGQSHSQSIADSENGIEIERDRERLALHAAGILDPNFLMKAFEQGGDMAGRDAIVALAAANGIKNIARQSMSQSPSPVYQSTNQPTSPAEIPLPGNSESDFLNDKIIIFRFIFC